MDRCTEQLGVGALLKKTSAVPRNRTATSAAPRPHSAPSDSPAKSPWTELLPPHLAPVFLKSTQPVEFTSILQTKLTLIVLFYKSGLDSRYTF